MFYFITIKRLNDWLLLNTQWTILQISWRQHITFWWWWWWWIYIDLAEMPRNITYQIYSPWFDSSSITVIRGMNTLTIVTPRRALMYLMSPAFSIILFRIRLSVFKATFKIILAISWRFVLLVEEIGELRKIQLPATSQIVMDKIKKVEFDTCLIEFSTKVVIGTGFLGKCNSRYHTIVVKTLIWIICTYW